MKATKIGRVNGPVTDIEVETIWDLSDIEAVKDTLAICNRVAPKDKWYIEIDGVVIIPELK